MPSIPIVESDVRSVCNALTIVLTSRNGVFSVASSVVFHGTHVVRLVVEEGVRLLNGVLNESLGWGGTETETESGIGSVVGVGCSADAERIALLEAR